MFMVTLAIGVVGSGQPFAPRQLRVEYLENPLTIDTPTPRFSWALDHSARGAVQASYRIQVWHNPPVPPHGPVAPVWASGVVLSNKTVNVPYDGSPLTSDSDYRWTVQWTDTEGNSSPLATATFSTAILEKSSWREAEWLSSPNNGSFDTYRSEFAIEMTGASSTASDIVRGRLYVAGLGFAKTYLNGNATDATELGQFVTFQKRVLYNCFDVTSLLVPGKNAIGIMLGNGWFAEPSINAGPRQFLMLLSVSLADGSTSYYPSSLGGVATHTRNIELGGGGLLTFHATTGPSNVPSMDSGEDYDGRIASLIRGWNVAGYAPGANGPFWTPAVAPEVGPQSFGSILSSHTVPILVDQDYSPVAIHTPSPGTYVFDFGQNMAGQVTLRVSQCPRGTLVSMMHTEILTADGHANNAFCERPKYWLCGVKQMANYTCSGDATDEVYRVTFVSMGFRYVQMLGFPGTPTASTLTAHFIHSKLPSTGTFTTSSGLLNSVQHATRFAAMSNAMDIPTDCPQRERRGWLGDAQLAFDTLVHNFDTAAFYTKWIRDLADAQEYNTATLNTTGALPDCAPFYGHGKAEADPGWGIAGWIIPLGFASYFDDVQMEQQWYAHSKAYADHWIQLAKNNSGILPIVSYGDWGNIDPGPLSFKPEIYPQFFFHQALTLQADYATRMNMSEDAKRYSAGATAAGATLLDHFFNRSTSCFGNCTDVEQIFGLATGLLPSGSQQERAAWAHALGWFNASATPPEKFGGGIVSLKLLYSLLDKFEVRDLGLRLQLHTDSPPSFGYWIAQNATTLWEDWTNSARQANSGLNSYNHIMFGSTGSWYFTSLGGIRRKFGSRSWNNLVIAPPTEPIFETMTWANASIVTPIGLVRSAWSVSSTTESDSNMNPGEAFPMYSLDVSVPPNSRAQVIITTLGRAATSIVTESGTLAWHEGVAQRIDGVTAMTAGSDGFSVIVEVVSGNFTFRSWQTRNQSRHL